MARIAGINIPQNKLVHIGLTYIYGIGDKFSQKILSIVDKPIGGYIAIVFSVLVLFAILFN